MAVPERYWRFPTRESIDSLALRFGLRNEPNMQDWVYEVADTSRLPEFLRAMEGDLTDDERFTLAQTVMQCFEEWALDGVDVGESDQWQRFAGLLRLRPSLHAYTLSYWSALESTHGGFAVTPLVRPLWVELEPAVGRTG